MDKEKKPKSRREGSNADEENIFTEAGTREAKFRKIIYISSAFVVVLILVLAFLLFKPSGPGVPTTVRQMEALAEKINTLESEVQEKQNEIISLMSEYKKETGEEFLGLNVMNLTDEERRILERKIAEEKNVSIKSLLEEILENNNEIQELKGRIAEMEALLPMPHIVESGENHYQIAMDFLMKEKKIEKMRAMKLVERTLLFDPLVPGFKVWNFYSGDEYGTSISQGKALISPNEVRRKYRKKLVDARDQAISERDSLAEEIKNLESKRTLVISQLELLNEEKESLLTRITTLNQQNLKMQRTFNSLHFLLDLRKNLKKRGIVKRGFLRSLKINRVSSDDFDKSIDLRTTDSIHVSAPVFGIRRIKKLVLLPRYYKKDKDYKIEVDEDKQNAVLMIMDKEKFRNERVVITVN